MWCAEYRRPHQTTMHSEKKTTHFRRYPDLARAEVTSASTRWLGSEVASASTRWLETDFPEIAEFDDVYSGAGRAGYPRPGAGRAGYPLEIREEAGIYFPGRAIYNEPIRINKGEYNLPHWELDATIYHVCFRLNDSVPMQKQMEWKREREWIIENAHLEKRELTEYEIKRLQYLYSDKIEGYLDAGYGECILGNPDVANIVQNSLIFYNGKKYRLHSWCIMPNHVHIAFQLLEHYRLSEVLQGWKSFTAHTINKFLGRTGALWQSDCYNHIIRTENEYYQQIRYIWHNPDKAGLINWQWRWKCID